MNVRLTVWDKSGKMRSAVHSLDDALRNLKVAERQKDFKRAVLCADGAPHDQEWIEREDA